MNFTSIFADAIERINAAWSVLDVLLLMFFGYYLLRARDKRWSLRSIIFHWNNPDIPVAVKAAISISVFHVGDLGVRFIVWLVRHRVNLDDPLSLGLILPMTGAICFFALVAGLGILCMLRVFSTPMLGQHVWKWAAIAAIAAAVLTTSLP